MKRHTKACDKIKEEIEDENVENMEDENDDSMQDAENNTMDNDIYILPTGKRIRLNYLVENM